MKNILFFVLAVCSVHLCFSQTTPSSHNWVLCDGKGKPLSVSGQKFYVIFRGNKIETYCGKDIITARSNGFKMSGTYGYDSNFIWWTWSNGEKSGDWIFGNNVMSSQDGKAMLRDASLFK